MQAWGILLANFSPRHPVVTCMLAESRDLVVRPADITTSADRLGPAKGTPKMPRFLKRLTLVASFACLTAQNGWAQPQTAVPVTPTAADTKIFAYTDVDQAWVAVQQSQRPLLLFVSTNNCYFCNKMEVETYVHPQILASIRELFVTAKIKKEQNPKLVEQLGVRAFPTTLLIAPNGDLITKIEGFADPKKFVLKIRPALAGLAKNRDRTAGRPADPSTTGQQ